MEKMDNIAEYTATAQKGMMQCSVTQGAVCTVDKASSHYHCHKAPSLSPPPPPQAPPMVTQRRQ